MRHIHVHLHDGPITILSSGTGRYKAELSDRPNGVLVKFYERLSVSARADPRGAWKSMGPPEVIDAPMHVVRDKIHAILSRMS